MLGKCPPIYHRSEPEADDANSDLDSDNQQAAVGEQQTKNNNKKDTFARGCEKTGNLAG